MKKISLALLLVSMIGFWGCNPNEEPIVDNKPAMLNFNIEHTIGGTDLALFTKHTLPSGEDVNLSRLSYILSNFYLVGADGTKTTFDSMYAIVEVQNNNTSFSLDQVNLGDYSAIGFSVGLDSNTNHSNPNIYPTDHPLAPINNSLHWSWQGGYIFMAIEGKTLADTASFAFHLAGAENRVDFEFPVDFTVQSGPTLQVGMNYDLAKLLTNYNIADEGASTHSTTDPITMKLFANMKNVFTLNSVSP